MSLTWMTNLAAVAGDEPAELLLYDAIGDDGLTAYEFAKELHQIDGARPVHLLINSQGGSVTEGLAIHAQLQGHPGHVTAYVVGMAASMASIIAMAADHVVIAPTAQMMIHDAQGFCAGTAADMREQADLLDLISEGAALAYAGKAHGPVTLWRKRMKQTTYYSATEALSAGLADEVGIRGGSR